VIQHAPRLVVGTPKLVIGTPKLVVSTRRLVVSAPRVSVVTQRCTQAGGQCSQVLLGFCSLLWDVSLALPGAPWCTWRPLHWSSKLWVLTTLQFWSDNSQTLLEAPSDQNPFYWWHWPPPARSLGVFQRYIHLITIPQLWVNSPLNIVWAPGMPSIDHLRIDHFQVLLQSRLIMACKCIPKTVWSWPQRASLCSLVHNLQVHL